MGRIKPGVTFAQASEQLAALVRRSILAAATGRQLSRLGSRPIDVPISSAARGLSRVRATFSGALAALMAGVAVLLLIVCVNVANLLLARGVARRREMALRAALGANRGRMVRQLLTESAAIALLAGAMAVIVAWWLGRGLILLATGSEPLTLAVDPNASTLLFTLGVAVASVLIFGVAPAVRASRVDLSEGMRAVGRSVATGARFGRWLIAAQVALSLVLLAGAWTLVRGVRRSPATNLGFDRAHLVVAKLDISSPGLAGTPLANVVLTVRHRVAALPGVVGVSFSENGLFDHSQWSSETVVPGSAQRTAEDSLAATDGVGANYAAAIGATIIAGRDLASSDEGPTANAVIVDSSFSNFYFHGANAIGRTISFGPHSDFRIVGVVAEFHTNSLDAPSGHYARHVFYPYLHGDDTTRLGQPSELRLVVRTRGDPASLVAEIRRAIHAAAPTLPIENAEPLTDLVRDSVRAEQLLSEITTALGVLALVLAALGLFSVMSYSVAQRTNEIGIRIALGAPNAAVRRMIVAEALRPVGLGLVVGSPLVAVALRLVAHQVAHTPPVDGMSLAAAAVVLQTTGVAAALLPALRASRIDPIEALKGE